MKKFLALILAVVMTVSLVACGKNNTPAGGDETWAPSGTVSFIAAAGAGSGLDTSGRQFAKLFNETGIVSSSIKVENDAGGAGQVGYTNFYNNDTGADDKLIVASAAMITGSIANNWDFDILELTPVLKVVVDSWVIVSKTGDTRYDTLDKVIAALQADPSSLKIGAAAPPDPDYLGLVMFCQLIGVDPNAIQYVVYDGGGDSVPALLGGDVDLCISTVGEFSTYVEAKQVTALAVASDNPLSGAYEGVPTFRSLNYDFSYGNWRGMFGPKDMPAEALAFWQDATKKLVETDAFHQTCADMQWIEEPVIDGFDTWLADYTADVTAAMKASGVIQ